MTRYDYTFVLPGLGINGGVKTLLEFVRRLAFDGARMQVVSHAPGPAASWVSDCCDVRVPGDATWRSVAAVGRFLRSVKRTDRYFDLAAATVAPLIDEKTAGRVVVGWHYWVDKLRLTQEPVGYAQHYEPLFFHEHHWHSRSSALMRSNPPSIINSSWLREKLPASANPHLVFPGVDLETFTPIMGNRKPTLGAPFRIAALGRSEPWKGLGDLVAALRLLTFDAQLTTFGDDHADTLLAGHIRRGRLTASELSNLYRSVDTVVTPSWYESFPLPPLEAMACGTVVTTTSEGTEDYAVDSENCLVVPPRSPEALALALTTIRERIELRRTCVKGGLETASRYTWDSGYQQLVSALAELS